jgi:hypothetical protein
MKPDNQLRQAMLKLSQAVVCTLGFNLPNGKPSAAI